MNIVDVVILSLIEGLTEFLPISSTAHLILTSNLLGLTPTEFLTTFEVSIQVGAIAAVCFYYFQRIWKQKELLYKACIGFIPTGLLGLILFKHIKVLLSDPLIPVFSLFVGGIAIIGIEMYFKQKRSKELRIKVLQHMTYKDALLIGLMQSVSMIPGVSRAAASIFGGMALRFDRKSAVEFSFLLAIPTMIAATALDLVKSAPRFSSNDILYIAIGIILSFITALFVIKWLLKYVQNNNFIGFGIYRIVLSILYYLIFLR